MEDEHETSALRHRRKKSSLSLTCCFPVSPLDAFDSLSSSCSSTPSRHRRSPSKWFKSRLGLHRRHASADFSYDPLSYALNFEDESNADVEEFPARSFSSRLPLSPPPRGVMPCGDSGVDVGRRNPEVPMEREEVEVLGLRRELPAVAEEGRTSVETVVSPVGVAQQPREILV